jgi:hypothetical protein
LRPSEAIARSGCGLAGLGLDAAADWPAISGVCLAIFSTATLRTGFSRAPAKAPAFSAQVDSRGPQAAFCSHKQVPELTRNADIKLNARLRLLNAVVTLSST